MFILLYIYMYSPWLHLPHLILDKTLRIHTMKFLSSIFLLIITTAAADSDIVIQQAKLGNINNTIPSDVSFDYTDFEQDIGGIANFSKSLSTGYVISYDSDTGFTIDHPDATGVIDVGDVLGSYQNLYGSQTTAFTSYISNNYLVQFSGWQSNVFKKITEFADDDSDSDDGTTSSATLNPLEKRGQYRCSNKQEQADCGESFASGNKIKSAHNCKNAGGKGYSCTFPQGPTGLDYGTCCYKINVAVTCNYEGGGCLKGNPGNSCGTSCIS